MTYDVLVSAFLKVCGAILAACALACLVRAVIGPRTADRLVAANMIGTLVMGLIASVCVISGEHGFIDIAVIYAMISFVAVVVLAKIIGRGHEK